MDYLHSTSGILLVVIALILAGCATSGQGGVRSNIDENTNESNSVKVVQNNSDSLTDYLRRIVGVKVIGDGPNARITIREKSSFNSDTTPLFVINGIRAGKDFSDVYSLLNPADIVEIEVVKGADTALYGMDGANGVIVISTK
ncbi:TonB-dependent receptor plug domain-containing protein [Halalkalibaculum sp. DA3122]|uniref:TonB-dependent receptor plug domain-containing protein n=1 Tax=Halalkalibaculum sp. DA3122 TaxID=3373607 RepID=UPI0037550C15